MERESCPWEHKQEQLAAGHMGPAADYGAPLALAVALTVAAAVRHAPFLGLNEAHDALSLSELLP